MNYNELKLSAIHEAGHTVVARYYGIKVRKSALLTQDIGITVYNLGVKQNLFNPVIEEKFDPSFYYKLDEDQKFEVETGIIMLFKTFIAGIVAENIFSFGNGYDRDIENDLKDTDDLKKIRILIDLNEVVAPNSKLLTIKEAEAEVRNIFNTANNWNIVSDIASIILKKLEHFIEDDEIDLVLEAYTFKKFGE